MKLYYNDDDEKGVLVWIEKNEIATFASEMVKSVKAWKRICDAIEEFPLSKKQYSAAWEVGYHKAQPFKKALQGVKTAVTKALKAKSWELKRDADLKFAELQREVYLLKQELEAERAR